MADKKAGPKKAYRISMMCHKSNNTMTTVEKVNTRSFKCPLCSETVLYLHKEHRLTGHGQATKGPDGDKGDHSLRRVVEIT